MICLGTTTRGDRCKLQALPGKEYCNLHQHSSIVISVRCSAIARNGNRCSHDTTRGTLCWQHLKKEKQLRIKKSGIPRAGLGLFTTSDRAVGEKLAPYTGDVVVTNDPNFGDNYALQIKRHPPTFISARRTNTGEGRFANDARRGRNNAKLIYNRGSAYLRSTKRIPAGSEITTSYGASYWRALGS